MKKSTELILYTATLNPAYSGAARRISIPGTDLARKGMISELRMSQIVAVTRLAMPETVLGNCTHEPCTLGAAAGANLFWAEIGANPRDTQKKTEQGRGHTVEHCRTLFQESGCGLLEAVALLCSLALFFRRIPNESRCISADEVVSYNNQDGNDVS